MVEDNYRPWTSFFEDRVLGVGRVSSCCSYQGFDHVWAQRCTAAVPMRLNWLGGTVRSPLIGCSRNIINLEKQRKGNSNGFGINSAH